MAAKSEQMVQGKWDFEARNEDELSFRKKETLSLLDDSKTWWKVKNGNGEVGYIPSNFVKKIELGFASKMLENIKQFKPRLNRSGGKGSHSQSHDDERDTRDVHGASTSQTSVICTAVAIRNSEYSVTDGGDMLSFRDGDRFRVLNISDNFCWIVQKVSGEIGRVEINHLSIRPQSKFAQKNNTHYAP